MKKTVLLFCLLTAVYACKDKTPSIEGSVSDDALNGKQICLYVSGEVENLFEDTAIIKKNKFAFKNLSVGVYYIIMEDSLANADLSAGIPVYVHEGAAKVRINNDRTRIGGNPENKALQAMFDELLVVPELQIKNVIGDYLENNIDNPLGEEILLNYIDLFKKGELEHFIEKASEDFRYQPAVIEAIATSKD